MKVGVKMNSYKFKLCGFDEMLNGATEEEKQKIKSLVESMEVNAENEIEAYEKLCDSIGGQELVINDQNAYLEMYRYSQGFYIEVQQ